MIQCDRRNHNTFIVKVPRSYDMLTMLASLSRVMPFFRSITRALTCLSPPFFSLCGLAGGSSLFRRRWRRHTAEKKWNTVAPFGCSTP